MAFLLVAKRNLLPLFSAPHLNLLLPRCGFSDFSTQTPHFMVDFLITSCGFSPDKAARISEPLAHLKSPQKPDSVLRFLKQQGFSEADIGTLIARSPKILCSSLENTLEPNLRALREMGFSSSTLTQLLLASPAALMLHSAPKIQFWRDFLGGDEATLIKVFKYSRGLVSHDIGRIVAPKISLLQSHGLSTHDIRRIVLSMPRFITLALKPIEDLLKRAEELGFRPESGMFVPGLHAMTSNPRKMLQKKLELLNSFGWSDDEFFSALHKLPTIITLSEKNLQMKMDFLIREVRCEPSYIALRPRFLTCSLEKRLRPRHRVLHLLESKGLYGERNELFSAVLFTDRKFVERYILPHKDEVSELHEAYSAACA